MADPLRLVGAAQAAVDAQQALIDEYRSQLAEARAISLRLARELETKQRCAVELGRALEEARRELVRKDDRIAELERQLEVGAWRERLGGL